MDKRASWSLGTHCRCNSCQRWSFLLSNLAYGEGFKSRFVFDWDHLYIFSSNIACWQLNFCNGWRELNVLQYAKLQRLYGKWFMNWVDLGFLYHIVLFNYWLLLILKEVLHVNLFGRESNWIEVFIDCWNNHPLVL